MKAYPLLLQSFVALCSFALLSCSTEADPEWTYIPETQSFCPGTVAGCSGANENKKIHIGLTSQVDTDCESFMAQATNLSQFALLFEASSSALPNHQSGGLYAIFRNWSGPLGQHISGLKKGLYKACAFLDINENGRFDKLTEPFAENLILIDRDQQPEVNHWTL